MSMTKKDYNVVAYAINTALRNSSNMLDELVDAFAAKNPSFKPQAFLEECLRGYKPVEDSPVVGTTAPYSKEWKHLREGDVVDVCGDPAYAGTASDKGWQEHRGRFKVREVEFPDYEGPLPMWLEDLDGLAPSNWVHSPSHLWCKVEEAKEAPWGKDWSSLKEGDQVELRFDPSYIGPRMPGVEGVFNVLAVENKSEYDGEFVFYAQCPINSGLQLWVHQPSQEWRIMR